MNQSHACRLLLAAVLAFGSSLPALAQEREIAAKPAAAPAAAPLTRLPSLDAPGLSLPGSPLPTAQSPAPIPAAIPALGAVSAEGSSPVPAADSAAVAPAGVVRRGASMEVVAGKASSTASRESGAAAASTVSKETPSLTQRVSLKLEKLRRAFFSLGRVAPRLEDDSSAVAGRFSVRRSFLLGRSIRAATLGLALGAATLGVPHPAMAQSGAAVMQQAEQTRVQRVSSADDIVRKWDPSAHVMVLGRLPGSVTDDVLQDLSAKLKGSHWTVVLVGDSQGLQYVDDNGRTQYGNDAVEFALGHGVAHKPAYGALVDARTGQSDGVLMFISYSPRYMWYRPSDAQNAVGLTKDAFSNDFIRIPRSVMQHGGDAVKAVTQTKSYVDAAVSDNIERQSADAKTSLADAKSAIAELSAAQARLSKAHSGAALSLPSTDGLKARLQKAQAEYEAKNLAAAASDARAVASEARQGASTVSGYETSFASSKDALTQAALALDGLDSAAKRFRAEHPKASGDLARPDVEAARAQLREAERLVEKDPAAALRAAQAVSGRAKATLDVLAAYAADGQQLRTLEGELKAQSGRANASAAADQLASARRDLQDARSAYERGESGYAAKLASAKASLEGPQGAQAAIDSADAAAARNRFLAFLFSLFAALGAFATGFVLNRRVKLVRAKALAKYDDLAEKVRVRDEVEFKKIDQRVDDILGPADKATWQGETAKAAAEIRDKAGWLPIIGLAVHKRLDEAKALVHPTGVRWLIDKVSPADYRKALDRMTNEKVEFSKDEIVAELFGGGGDYRKDLYGDITSDKTISASFEDLVKSYNEKAKFADDRLSEIQKAITDLEPAVQKIEAASNAAQALKGNLDAAGKDDGFFLVPALFAALLPAAAAALAALRQRHSNDPLGAMDSSGADATRMSAEARALAEFVLSARAGALAKIAQSEAALAASGIDTAGLLKRTAELSAAADALATQAVKTSLTDGLAKLGSDLDALAAKAAAAVEFSKRLAALREAVAAQAGEVAQARLELGRALGLDADKILRDSGDDPSALLVAATKAADAAKAALDKGALDAAAGALDAGANAVASAKAVVADSKAAVAAQAQTVAQRQAEAQRLKDAVPEHEALLKQIRKSYAASVLSLRSGDPAHPDANGTIDDNIDEANAAIQAADAKTAKSVQEFREGRVLDAAHLLAQAQAHQAIAQHRLSEIAEKKARLDKTVASNQTLLEALQAQVRRDDSEIAADKRSMKATDDALDAAERKLKAAADAVAQVKGDPFDAESQLLAVKSALEQVSVMFRNDADLYAHAGSSLQSADQALSRANAAANDARGDGIADSAAITQAYAQLQQLAGALSKAKAAYSVGHGDWHAVDVEAGRVAAEAGHAQATLRSELEAAQSASAAIENAARKVREATSWTGSYGVSVPGSPGSGELSSARGALSSGDYSGAQRYAESARSAAASAIAYAEAEVQRRYQAEQERLAEERRRREEEEAARQRAAEEERRRSEDSGGGGGFGGFSSGGGGGGFGGSGSGGGGGSW